MDKMDGMDKNGLGVMDNGRWTMDNRFDRYVVRVKSV